MESNQSEFKLDSLATFPIDSLRELLFRVTRMASESDCLKSKPIRWFIGLFSDEANRRLASHDGELVEQGMVSYPMTFEWTTRELRDFVAIMTTLSYSTLDAAQAKFVDGALWYAIAETFARCQMFESKGLQNVA